MEVKYEKGEFTSGMYNEQVDWETHYLRLAGKKGVVMFWLANEFEHRCDRAYAQTTRFELGEWKQKHEKEGAKLVVGICGTLETTCLAAIQLARQ